MQKLLLILSLLVLICTACAPKVTTTVIKTYPENNDTTAIKVLYQKDTLINGEILGEVKVRDGGFTTKCDSASVIGHIEDKARKMGGNAIYITEHERPSIWSSCHQMEAKILLLKDSDATALSLAKADTTEKILLKNNIKPELQLYKLRFAANGGYAWRIAEINPALDAQQRKHIEQLTSGGAWDVSLDYFFSNLWGLGLNYAGYSASASTNMNTGTSYKSDLFETNDLITYIGPSVLMRHGFTSELLLSLSMGLGYIEYTSKEKYQKAAVTSTGSTLGVQYAAEMEYKFSENWGAGFKVSMLGGILNSITTEGPYGRETKNLPDGSEEGLGQVRLLAGLRCYFK